MTCYFGKYNRIAVGVMILSKIPKIRFHNSNGYSLEVVLTSEIFLNTSFVSIVAVTILSEGIVEVEGVVSMSNLGLGPCLVPPLGSDIACARQGASSPLPLPDPWSLPMYF